MFSSMYSLESDSDSELSSNTGSDVVIISVEPGHANEQLIRLVLFESITVPCNYALWCWCVHTCTVDCACTSCFFYFVTD